MIEKLKARFCEDAPHWYKMWSTWLAVVWGAIVTVVWNNPEMLSQVLEALPPELRAYLSPVVLTIVSSLPVIIRLMKQRSVPAAPSAPNDKA